MLEPKCLSEDQRRQLIALRWAAATQQEGDTLLLQQRAVACGCRMPSAGITRPAYCGQRLVASATAACRFTQEWLWFRVWTLMYLTLAAIAVHCLLTVSIPLVGSWVDNMEIMSADGVASGSTAPRQAGTRATVAEAEAEAEATPALPAVPSSAPSPSPAALAGPTLHAPPALPPPDRMRVLLELQPAGAPGAPSTPPHPVFKSDGSRFGSTDTTVKLSHQGAYRLSVVCSPPSTIDHAELLVSALRWVHALLLTHTARLLHTSLCFLLYHHPLSPLTLSALTCPVRGRLPHLGLLHCKLRPQGSGAELLTIQAQQAPPPTCLRL